MEIKTTFSIKDLENLSGVKAGTIRIWEKRYNLLTPLRTDTNIRKYSTKSLQRILNITYLLEQGNKISTLSLLSQEEIHHKVRELATRKNESLVTVQAFKMAMINFDQGLFEQTYNQLIIKYSFHEIFINIIMKLLEEIGHLWTSKTITPIHEHFISNLIKQKLLVNIEKVQSGIKSKEPTYILFLPLNEIHELGLLFIHYKLLLGNKNSIYLGSNVPIQNLIKLKDIFDPICYVSYFTVEPKKEKVNSYFQQFKQTLLNGGTEFHSLGRNVHDINEEKLPPNIFIHKNINEFLSKMIFV